MSTSENRLSKLTTPSEYQAARPHVFPSKTSLQWFMRTRREQLVQASALLLLNGRILIDAEAFDAVVLAVGREQVQAGA